MRPTLSQSSAAPAHRRPSTAAGHPRTAPRRSYCCWYYHLATVAELPVHAEEVLHRYRRRGQSDSRACYRRTALPSAEVHPHWRPQATAGRCAAERAGIGRRRPTTAGHRPHQLPQLPLRATLVVVSGRVQRHSASTGTNASRHRCLAQPHVLSSRTAVARSSSSSGRTITRAAPALHPLLTSS